VPTLLITGSREELARFSSQIAESIDGGDDVVVKPNYDRDSEILFVLKIVEEEGQTPGLLYDWLDS